MTPIIVYNIPASSGFDIVPEFYGRLTTIPNIKYIKDSTGDLMRVEQLIAMGADVLNGNDFLALPALLAGAAGCFWGGANIMPKQCVELYNHVIGERLVEANELWKTMKPANMFIWNNHYNSSVKAACRLMGNDIGECRLPVVPLRQEKVEELKTALKPLLS
jgi:4-hydroxy-tetrahydrodipicolinate synthase